jgi:hypothetical protein
MLLLQISGFRSQSTFVDNEPRRRIPCVEEQSLQQDRAFCLQQTEVSDLQAVRSRLDGNNGKHAEANKALQCLFLFIQKEVAGFGGRHVREIVALTAESAKENSAISRSFPPDEMLHVFSCPIRWT